MYKIFSQWGRPVIQNISAGSRFTVSTIYSLVYTSKVVSLISINDVAIIARCVADFDNTGLNAATIDIQNISASNQDQLVIGWYTIGY